MRVILLVSAFIGAIALLNAPARAQAPAAAPAPVPDVMPFDIPFGPPIGVERAKLVAAAAIAEAKKRNWKMVVAIVEPSGDLVYFEKMDGTQYASIRIAPGKAKAAAMFRRPTKVFMDLVNGGQPYVLGLEGAVTSEGGLPIVADGKLIGAIGVSGGTSAQDGVIAKAGTDTVK
ncbi:MAG: heme-binding protein [Proteobacteria bacterium]|nr:heme-binding protein [Pseudomonadota bacterium]